MRKIKDICLDPVWNLIVLVSLAIVAIVALPSCRYNQDLKDKERIEVTLPFRMDEISVKDGIYDFDITINCTSNKNVPLKFYYQKEGDDRKGPFVIEPEKYGDGWQHEFNVKDVGLKNTYYFTIWNETTKDAWKFDHTTPDFFTKTLSQPF